MKPRGSLLEARTLGSRHDAWTSEPSRLARDSKLAHRRSVAQTLTMKKLYHQTLIARVVVPLLLVAAACSVPEVSPHPQLRTGSSALTVAGVYPTGVDNAGAPLPGGSADPHYTLVASDDPAFVPPFAAPVMVDGYPIGGGVWVDNSASSKWISVQSGNSGTGGSGDFTFRTVVNLLEVDPATAKLDLLWSADNSVVLKVNSTTIAATSPSYTSYLTLSATTGFVAGSNNLDFVVNNGGGPLGLRVDAVSLTANCTADAQCSNTSRWCDGTFNGTPVCENKLGNGVAIEGGTCTAALSARSCVSGACSVTDNLCGLTNGEAAANTAQCRSGARHTDGSCGLPNGEASANAGECRSGVRHTDGLCGLPNGVASASATECRSGVRHTDGLCGLPNGVASASATECRGSLRGSNGQCGLVNGQAACTAGTAAAACQSAVCDVDGSCGLSNGAGTCTSTNAATVCRSGLCSAAGTCLAAGACASDNDCSGGWCKLSTATCNPKLPNERPLPTDPAHTSPVLDGKCSIAAATLICVSGVCDTSDNACGFADGTGPCTQGNAATVCRSGSCKSSGVCGTNPVVTPDAGAPDSGIPISDSGVPAVDSGASVVDAGRPVTSDASTSVADAAAPARADASVPASTDSGVVIVATSEDGSVQGGGVACSASDQSSPVSAMGIVAAFGLMAVTLRKRAPRAA